MSSTRREFLAMVAAAIAVTPPMAAAPQGPERLSSRPSASPRRGKRGMRQTSFGTLYVPRSYDPAHPAPLLVALHGAGGNGRRAADFFKEQADLSGMIVLAPDSNGRTWDMIEDQIGPDVEDLDAALAQLFASYAVDARHLAVGGFSDGASYALTLGLANGDLFTHILAFSPGFFDDVPMVGKARIFVSHGNADPILPIDRCSRRIVPRLQMRRYEVRYREFDGGHTMPPEIVSEAMDWFRR